MTQSADQPLLAEQSGAESTPPKRRRATPAKPPAKVTATANGHDNGDAPVKPRARRSPKKADGAPQEELALEPTAPVAPAPEPSNNHVTSKPEVAAVEPPKARRTPRSRKASRDESPVTSPRDATRDVEEWSPTRAESAPAPVRETAAPAPAPAAEAPSPPAEAPIARKYPVYIPRHVAKQMEEQGQTAPLAVPADAIPEAARAAVEAAQAAQAARSAPAPRPEGQHPPQHQQQQQRGDRQDRNDRHRERSEHRQDRYRDRNERHNRGGDPGDRGGQSDRETADYVHNEGALGEEVGFGEGIVEISGKGFGFIRDAKRSFAQHPQDIFVTPEIVRKYNLRDGQWIKGETRRGGRGAQLCKLTEVNGSEPDAARILPAFDELTVISPMERITLYTTPERTTTRIIDLFAPIGKGQRGLIVAPPRTGKTTLLQHIADAVVKKHPDITLIILLVDERPEEVTDMKRTIPTAEVMASSNDMDVKSHTRIAQLAIERAKRLVESGKDVFVLLDSITRVGRAFNNASTGGRTMSGGIDSKALEIPRRLFAAARNTEEAGSLTIVATALIETGSKGDELIFQEFKGTGNMELVLDRKISDQRIYPAIDIFQSGTRREELLIPADDLHKIAVIRRGLAGHKPLEAIERLLYFLRKFPTDSQMLREIPG